MIYFLAFIGLVNVCFFAAMVLLWVKGKIKEKIDEKYEDMIKNNEQKQ